MKLAALSCHSLCRAVQGLC